MCKNHDKCGLLQLESFLSSYAVLSNSPWTDFLENIVSMAKQDLRIKKFATKVVFNDNNYVLDFYNIMLLDLISGM
ncbi:hypothetical protein MTR67_031050 [Solanum verrucosum]|uniref:RCD1 WWE domain-containing protein n=1 Tax=Solanum verrucosum TaxID=315347 RepID=A0AAF0U1R2_SOLVR|nr:hypothetical protein MTR67_031050 [Solanum verrucosum]